MTSPGTKRRGVRISDELWAEYQEACEVAGVNASEQVRRLIQEWLDAQQDDHQDDHPDDEGEK